MRRANAPSIARGGANSPGLAAAALATLALVMPVPLAGALHAPQWSTALASLALVSALCTALFELAQYGRRRSPPPLPVAFGAPAPVPHPTIAIPAASPFTAARSQLAPTWVAEHAPAQRPGHALVLAEDLLSIDLQSSATQRQIVLGRFRSRTFTGST